MPIKFKVWEYQRKLYLNIKDTEPIVVAESESELYQKVENMLHSSLLAYHRDGALWQIFPEYSNSNGVEIAQIVCYPYSPPWKKLINKVFGRNR